MRRFSLISLAVAAVLVVAAIPAALAVAGTPEILPTAGAGGRTTTGASEGEPLIVGVLNLKCKKVPTTGTQGPNDTAGGSFHMTFEGCENTATVKSCTGTTDTTSGVILALGTWVLVWDREVGGSFALTVATVFLFELLKFGCGGAVAAEVKGEVVCLDLKPTEESKTHSFHCIPALEGTTPLAKQKEEYCSADPCTTWTKPLLLTSLNKGAFLESSLFMLGTWTTTEATFADAL